MVYLEATPDFKSGWDWGYKIWERKQTEYTGKVEC